MELDFLPNVMFYIIFILNITRKPNISNLLRRMNKNNYIPTIITIIIVFFMSPITFSVFIKCVKSIHDFNNKVELDK